MVIRIYHMSIDYVTQIYFICLDKRRLRRDLIEMFKILKDIENFNNMFKLNNSNCLRGNKCPI